MKTEKEICALAMQVQDACNPKAVARLLVETMDIVSQTHNCGNQVQNHPAVIALIDKLSSMSGIQNNHSKIMDAFDECDRIGATD
jgi:hypothetical protein